MLVISLGGIGGCDLAQALRNLNQFTYPYDWLITTQSFVISSFNRFDLFFDFHSKYVYDRTKLLTINKKAIMLHDFKHFNLEKEKVIDKYKRRFDRLNESLCGEDDILFVRIYDNLAEELIPKTYYDDIFIREKEDLEKWNYFISSLKLRYSHKNINMLIITSCNEICDRHYDNLKVCFTQRHKNVREIQNIIQKMLMSI